MSTERYDVAIVGARVAGAATALQLARAGARVLLMDRSPRIGDTLSTHALMRPAVMLLERWGLAEPLIKAGTAVVRKTVFQYGSEKIAVDISPHGDIDGLIAPRRALLDNMLVDAAVDAGAELRLATQFEGCTFDKWGRVTGLTLRDSDAKPYQVACDFAIGADGWRSSFANAVKAPFLAKTPRGSATVYGYFGGLPNEGYRWMFAKGLQCGLIPTDAGLHCAFASVPIQTFKSRTTSGLEHALVGSIARFDPEVATMMQTSGSVGKLYRFGGAEGHIRQASGNGWALVGDAGYFKDPATAHGISDALIDSYRLTETLTAAKPLIEYDKIRNTIAFDFLDVTARIADLNWDLDVLKSLHIQLNNLMKHEALELSGEMRCEKVA